MSNTFNGYKYVLGDIAIPENVPITVHDVLDIEWNTLPTGLLSGERLYSTIDVVDEEDAIYAASATAVVFREATEHPPKCGHTDAVLITGSSLKDGSRVALIIDIPDQATYLRAPAELTAQPDMCDLVRDILEEMLQADLYGSPERGHWISSVTVEMRSWEEEDGHEPELMFAIRALNHEVHRTIDNLIRQNGLYLDTHTLYRGLYDLTSVSSTDWFYAHYGIAPFKVFGTNPTMLVGSDARVTVADREYRCRADQLRTESDPSSLPGVRPELLDALHIAVMDIETMAINPVLTSGDRLTDSQRMKARAVDDHGFPQEGQCLISQIGLGVATREDAPGRVTGLPGALNEGLLFNLGPTLSMTIGSERLDNGGETVKPVCCTDQASLLALYFVALHKYKAGLEMGYNSHDFDWTHIDELTRVIFESINELGLRLLWEYGLKKKFGNSRWGMEMPEPEDIARMILVRGRTIESQMERIEDMGDKKWVVRCWMSQFISEARRRVAARIEFREGLFVLGRPGDGLDPPNDVFLDRLGENLAEGVVRQYVPDWDARMRKTRQCFYKALISLLSWVKPNTLCSVRRPGIQRTPDRLHRLYKKLKKDNEGMEEPKVFVRKFINAGVVERETRVSWSKQSGTRKATSMRAVGSPSADGLMVHKNINKTEDEYGLKYTMRQLAKSRDVEEVLVLEAPYDRITPRMVAALKFYNDVLSGVFRTDEQLLTAARSHLAGVQNLGVYCGCSDVPATLTVVADLLGLYKAIGSMSGGSIADFYMGVSRTVRGVMYNQAHAHNTSFPPKTREDDQLDVIPEEEEESEEDEDEIFEFDMPNLGDGTVLLRPMGGTQVEMTIPTSSKKQADKTAKQLKKTGYTGATVLYMRRGRYPGWCVVVVTDFAHLYPAIMISNSIGASSMVQTPKDVPLEDFLATKGLTLDDVYRPTMRPGDPVYRRTVKYVDNNGEIQEWRGTLASTEETLLELREHYKGIMKAEDKVLAELRKLDASVVLSEETAPAYFAKCAKVGSAPVLDTVEKAVGIHTYRYNMGNVMQLAAKVVCNSGYGFVGQKTSFLPTACAGSVTGGGMTVIMVAKGMVESLWRVGKSIPSIHKLTVWADQYRHLLETEGEAARNLVVNAESPIIFNGDIMSCPRPMWDGLREWSLAYSKPTVERYYTMEGSEEIAALKEQKKLDNRKIGVTLQKRAREMEGTQTLFQVLKMPKRLDGSSSSSQSTQIHGRFCSGNVHREMQAQLPKSLRDIGCVVMHTPGLGPGYHLYRPLESYEMEAGPCPIGRLVDATPEEMGEQAFRRFERWCEMRQGDLSKATPERVAAAVHPDRIEEAMTLAESCEMTKKDFESMQPPCGIWFDATTVYGDTDSTFVNVVALSPYVAHFVCEMIEALTRLAFVVPKDLVFEAEKIFMARPTGLVYDEKKDKMTLAPSTDPMFPKVKLTWPDPNGVGFWGKTMKQYAALKVAIGKTMKIVLSQTGLVGKKRGVPPQVKKYLKRLLNEASLGFSLEELEATVSSFLEDLATGKYTAAHLRVTAAYNPEKKGKGTAMAKYLERHGIHVGPGTRIPWYYAALARPTTSEERKAIKGANKGPRSVPYAIGVRDGIPPDYELYVEIAVNNSNEYLRDAYETPDACRLAMAGLMGKYKAMARDYMNSLEWVGRVPLSVLGVETKTRAQRVSGGLMSMFTPRCHCGEPVNGTSNLGVTLCPSHAGQRADHLRLELEGMEQVIEETFYYCRTECPIFAAGNFQPENCMEIDCVRRVRVLGEQKKASNVSAAIVDLEDLVL
jgi:hypothetical protein